MNQIKLIEEQLFPLRERLKSHDLYYHLTEIADIKIFMQKHVYAVWDFMSLLKALQGQLTCTSIPWKPSSNPKTARFINEIVLEEESDIDANGVPKSHFEMYLEAMNEVGASTSKILNIAQSYNSSEELLTNLKNIHLADAEKAFIKFTFDTIQTSETHKIAAAFTFGREEIIPDLFIQIINRGNNKGSTRYPKLSYYLNRHIELDGEDHGPMSISMISELCGESKEKWMDVLKVSQTALKKRISLWDEITQEIKQRKNLRSTTYAMA